MKGSLGFVIAIVGVIAAGVLGFKKYDAKAAEAEKVAAYDRIQREYLERVGWIRSNPDEKSYKEEVSTFFRWYFTQLNDYQNKFGGNRDFDDYLKELDTRAAKGGDTNVSEKKKQFETVKALFDQFHKGTYSPAYTASDKGMRLDIVSADVKMDAGQPKIHLPIVLWGAQREIREDGKTKRIVTSAAFSANWKLFDDKGKLYGEMNGGDPSAKNDIPDRFITEFPSQMVLGYYDIDLLPAKVAKVEMTIGVNSRAPSGGEAQASFKWSFDAPAEWKLKDGEEWKGATEDVRPPEEIDPASAKAPAGKAAPAAAKGGKKK